MLTQLWPTSLGQRCQALQQDNTSKLPAGQQEKDELYQCVASHSADNADKIAQMDTTVSGGAGGEPVDGQPD